MKPTYIFDCPMCSKRFKSDEPGEPCCTGPSESRDDHPMEVMRLVSVDYRQVAPIFSERRATGVLLMPGMEEAEQEARRLVRV